MNCDVNVADWPQIFQKCQTGLRILIKIVYKSKSSFNIWHNIVMVLCSLVFQCSKFFSTWPQDTGNMAEV